MSTETPPTELALTSTPWMDVTGGAVVDARNPPPLRLDAGFHGGIAMRDYINDPCMEPSLSRGTIDRLIHKTPLHCYNDHPRLGALRFESWSPAADRGSAAHLRLLGGDQKIRYVDAPDWRTKAAKTARDDARNENRIPMLEKERAPLDAMVVIAREFLAEYGDGDTEQVMIWQEGPTWFRTRHDWIAKDRRVVIDYKTSTTADPTDWIRRVLFGSNHELQNGLYLRGLNVLEGVADRDFLFLVQEVEAPYACSFVGIDPEVAELANRKIEAAIYIWRECMESGDWPAYGKQVHWANLPVYKLHDWENRAAAYITRKHAGDSLCPSCGVEGRGHVCASCGWKAGES